MELVDGNTGQRVDLTDKIRSCLKEFAKFLILKIQDVMPAPSDKVYKYVYFGGVAPILETSIHEVIEEMYGVEIAQANHIFLPDSRKLNLYGLEVKSRGEMLQKQRNKYSQKGGAALWIVLKRRRNKQSLGFEQIT